MDLTQGEASILVPSTGEAAMNWQHAVRISLATAILTALSPGAIASAATNSGLLESPAPAATTIPLRTLMDYVDGAWTGQASIVLRSPDEWVRWNQAMVDAGLAYGAEELPAGVDWHHESVLVVTAGEQATVSVVEMDPPERKGRKVRIHGRIKATLAQGISTPARVVAFERRHADDLELDPTLGQLQNLSVFEAKARERLGQSKRNSRIDGTIAAAPTAAVSAVGAVADLQAVPNPSPGRTTITWTLGHPGRIEASVYDATGRRVRELVGEATGAGARQVDWDGRDASGAMTGAGIYFVRMRLEGDPGEARVVRVIAVR